MTKAEARERFLARARLAGDPPVSMMAVPHTTEVQMATKIYGASDDLIEFEGDVRGEACGMGMDKDEAMGLIVCSDGTTLGVVYGDGLGRGIWKLTLFTPGSLFDRIDVCTSEDADPYSDVAHLKTGLTGAYVAKKWERVR